MPSKPPDPTGVIIDPWFDRYADRTRGLSASEVRALFAVASRPEVVSLAGGMPNVSALPDDLVAAAVDDVFSNHSAVALQYGSGQGRSELREHIVEIMSLEGIAADADDLVVTTGSQHALDLITRLFINPGDVIIAEGPSYVGALGVFRSYQADVVHVPLDDDGLPPEAFEATIERLDHEHKTIKFLYTIPNFHNPAGVTLSEERRPQILDIAKRHGIVIVEDNPYGLLHFGDPVPPAIRSLDDESVIYLGSFSKILAPGFRIGYVLAPFAVKEKLVLENEASVLSPSAVNQLIITSYLDQADWRGQIDVFRGMYRGRRDAMLEALTAEVPNLRWTRPNGGFYVWLSLPPELDSKAMLPLAVRELVAYTPGTAFFADGSGADKIRLSFCYPPPDEIKVGVHRLATVIENELDLVSTFRPSAAGPQKGTSSINNPAPNMN